MMGLKPVVEFMSWSFSLVAADPILNNAPKMLYMSGGQFGCPVVFRGNDGADSDFKRSRAEATADYRIWRVGANFTRAFAQDWQFRTVLTGQFSEDALVAGEQFGYGGPDSVRGFKWILERKPMLKFLLVLLVVEVEVIKQEQELL